MAIPPPRPHPKSAPPLPRPVRIFLCALASVLEWLGRRSPRGFFGGRLASTGAVLRTVAGGNSDINPDPKTLGRLPRFMDRIWGRSPRVATIAGSRPVACTASGGNSDIRPIHETGGAAMAPIP